MRVNVNFFLIHKIKNQRWPLVIYLFLHVNFKVRYVLTRWNPFRVLVHNRCTRLSTYLRTYLKKTSLYLSLQCKPRKKMHVWILHNRSSTYCVMIAMQKFEVKSSTHHHHHQFLWPNDVFRVSLYKAMSTLRLLSWVAFVVVGESNCKISFSGVSGEIFGHGWFETLVSPSPTGYMLWYFGFSLLIWSMFSTFFKRVGIFLSLKLQFVIFQNPHVYL